MKKSIISFVCFCAAVAAQAGEIIVVKSEKHQVNDSIYVFSPSKRAKDVPVIFLMNGRSSSFRSWSNRMDMDKLAKETGWRIICPDGFKYSWYLDSEKIKWRQLWWEEIWPELDSRFHFNPEKTFISGLSMGGHGAVNIFLDHPEKFKAAGSMSGVLDLNDSKSPVKDIPELAQVVDSTNTLLTLSSATYRITKADPEVMKTKLFVVTCGTADHLVTSARSFEKNCIELGYPCVAIYNPAKHTWPYWRWMTRIHIDLFRQFMEDSSMYRKMLYKKKKN